MAHAPRHRFLLVDVERLGDSAEPLALAQLQGCIRDSVQENFGDLGAGGVLSSLRIQHWSPQACACLVRVERAHASMLRAALTLVRFAQREPVRLTVTRVAGNARNARRLMVERLRERLRAAEAESSAPGADSDLRRQIAELSQGALE